LLFAHTIFLGDLINFLIYIIEILKELKISCFFVGKFLQNFKMDKNKCPKTDLPKYFPRNTCFRCIIEIYGLGTKKIIFSLLR
jgi:hypothetical protein